jgi:hypothetical protein
MATIGSIVNTVECSISGLLGSGSAGCGFELDNLSGGQVRLWAPGVVVPSGTTYNRAYMRAQQQLGNVKIYSNIHSIEWIAGENAKETVDGSGLSTVTRDGIYGIKVYFSKGLYSQKQFASVSLNSYWTVQFVDGSGNELWAKTSAGDLTGISTSYVWAMPLVLKNGTTSQKTGFEIEFSKSVQINERLAWTPATELDFSNEDIDGTNDVVLTFPTAPSDTDTIVPMGTVLAKDGNFVSGLTVDDLLVKKNGSTLTPTTGYTMVADATDKQYDITFAVALATADVVTVQLYDGTAVSGVILVGTAPNDKAYQSNTATTTVVA